MGDDASDGTRGSCEACGSALVDGKCLECEKPGATRERANEAMEYVRSQMEAGKRRGVDLAKVEDLLTGAQFMFEAGNFEDALRLIAECGEAAGDMIIQHDALISALKQSAKKIQAARDSGCDTNEAMTYLKLAEDALKKTEYKLGINYAVKSGDLAERCKSGGAQVEPGKAWLKGM